MARISFMMEKTPIPPTPPVTSFTFLLHNPDDSSGQGVVLGNPASQSDLAPLTYKHYSAMLSDGRVVVPGYDGDGPVVVNCYLAGTTTLDWTYTIVGSAFGYYADVGVLNNGNIVVTWGDYDVDKPYFVILSPSGGLVQGITDADTTGSWGAESDYPVTVTPLIDGGFFILWTRVSFNHQSASSWNADGTNKWPYQRLEGGDEDTKPLQLPTGGTGSYPGFILVADHDEDYTHLYNPDDLTDDWEYVDIGLNSPTSLLHMAKAPSWTDKIAIVWAQGGETVVTILDNDADPVGGYSGFYKQLVIAGISPIDLIALPDDTFLLQYEDGALEYGQSYYILDEDFNIVSGPHTTFTGLTEDSYDSIHGCAV